LSASRTGRRRPVQSSTFAPPFQRSAAVSLRSKSMSAPRSFAAISAVRSSEGKRVQAKTSRARMKSAAEHMPKGFASAQRQPSQGAWSRLRQRSAGRVVRDAPSTRTSAS